MQKEIKELYSTIVELNKCFDYLFKNIIRDKYKFEGDIYNYLNALKGLSEDLKCDFDEFIKTL